MTSLATRTIMPGDDDWPGGLDELGPYPPPQRLHLRGGSLGESAPAVAVVGTRRPTGAGVESARGIAQALAEAGFVVVSGLAVGIDAVAHEAALAARGRTVAVLGCGLDVDYPRANRALKRRIEGEGTLLSEYPDGTPPRRAHFPARNRLIAGLSLGVLVTEAPAKSGALITTDFAAEQGRDIFAVPGSILGQTSAGCHELLKDGAKLVTGAEDILVELNLATRSVQAETRRALPENDDERAMLRILGDEPAHINEIGHASGLPMSQVGSLLLMMADEDS